MRPGKEFDLVSVKDTASITGISEEGIRLGLQQGVFKFGVAVKHKINYEYYIFSKRLEKYLRGDLWQ